MSPIERERAAATGNYPLSMKGKTMFDITTLEISDSTKYAVTSADGTEQFDEKGRPITITVASPGTEKAMRAQHVRDEKQASRSVALLTGKSQKNAEAAKHTERAEFLAAITESFDNFSYGGKSGYEAYKALYLNPKLGHIADGVEKTFNDRGNFMPDAPKTSPDTSGTSPG